MKNYHPIALLYITSKILERLFYNKIITLVSKSITKHQFGFQSNSSTLQQLLIYFNQLITSKDKIDVIYIDFQKAFDSVPLNELLMKLWNIGITGTGSTVIYKAEPNVAPWKTIYLTFCPCSLEYPRVAYWVPFCL